ncbi:MAG TPA: ATP-binding protein, partial [Candidatus Kapabacteria bacterium]|nr:ATP-binding protein [Candidatus Kapabacteria bacterium]
LFLLVLAVSVIGITAGTLVTALAYQSQKQSLTKRLESTAQVISSALDLHIGTAETILRTLSAASSLENGDLQGFHELCSRAATTEDAWIVLDDAEGQQLVNTRAPFGTALPKVQYDSDEIAAYKEGKAYISDLVIGPMTKQHLVYVGIPIQKGERKFSLFARMRAASLSSALSVNDLAPNATISVVDRNGLIISRSKGGERQIGTLATPDMVDAVLNKRTGLAPSVTKEGVPVFSAIARSQLSGWSVLVGVPKGDLLISAQRLMITSAAIACGLLLLAAGFSIWIGTGLVRAVGTLVTTTQSISTNSVPTAKETGLSETNFVLAALRKAQAEILQRKAQLAHATEDLERRITARTEDLSQAQRRLLRANNELESFAHVAVREMREPLRQIEKLSGSLDSSLKNTAAGESSGYVERIAKASSRMGKLLESIFAYSSRNDPGHSPQITQLNKVLDDVIADLEWKLKETNGRIVAGELGEVLADPADIHQLLLNLVGNALKFHKPGTPPLVLVESGRVGPNFHLVIRDNGIGFDSAHSEKIFEPFERLNHEQAFEGTGLGLAIVRRIAERQGGSVHASSVPGVGSQFVIILRAAPSEQAKAVQV